jgi:hypothetical protein
VTRRYAPWLTAIVGVSFLARTVVAWHRAVPALFPDEYTYAALGRSIASSGSVTIRGSSPHFPALLEPIVMAPAWLVGDVGLAYRLVQTIGALAMSLAAVPVFLLARRLGLSSRVALALAALSVLVPDLVYASFVTSEAIAYPLVLAAVCAGVSALAAPSRRSQIAFVVFAALATLTRIQFAALPVVFLVAALLVGARERRVKAALREQLLPLIVFAVPVLALVATGPAHLLGPYRAVFGFRGSPFGVVHWASLDAMSIAYAAGWIVIPGALLGLWLSVVRPRSRTELSFAVFTVLLAVVMLVEAGALQASMPLGKEIQERYVFYAVPLLGIAFALYAARGWPLRIAHLVLAAGLILVSVRLPLSSYAIASTLNGSAILYGVYWLAGKLGQDGAASTIVAGVVGVLSVVAVLASRRPRVGTPLVLGLALLATGVASAGAVAFDVSNTRIAKHVYLPSDPSWVDRAKVGSVTLVQAWGGSRTPSLQELFWNRSVERVALLPGAAPFDRYGDDELKVRPDGSMAVDGKPLTGPLLLDQWGSLVRLQNARLLQAGPTAALWVPDRGQRPRLAMYAVGRAHDGWLSDRGAVYLWPARPGGPIAGRLTLRLTVPAGLGGNTLTFRLPHGQSRSVVLPDGASRTVTIPVCGRGDWYATYSATVRRLLGLRPISALSTVPVFRPAASACRGVALQRSSSLAAMPITTA